MKAYVEAYGCAHNESDARIIKGSIIHEGHSLVDTPEDADIIFLVTCGVKLGTERKMIHRTKELLGTGKRVIVCGCLPKINEADLRKAGATEFLDTDSLSMIPEVLADNKVPFATEREDKHSLPCVHGTHAIIQISEGCLGACAFCGTRNARGVLHSYPLESIVDSCRLAIEDGAKELWITSEDTGIYGCDTCTTLDKLINAITALEGDFRIRIGMMNPGAALRILPELLETYDSDKVFKFVHVPVQSGSDLVLKAMRRQHGVEEFERVSKAFRDRFPECVISTDIIVGFPGETDEDFQKTLELLKRVKPDVTNVSKFYPRPNTLAAGMKKIPTEITKKRSVECARLGKELSLSRNELMVGKEFIALVLEKGRTGGLIARAPNYKIVALEGAAMGAEYGIRVASANTLYLDGEILYTSPSK